MVLQIASAALWILKPIDNAYGDYGVFHCLIHLGFQILSVVQVVPYRRCNIYEILIQFKFLTHERRSYVKYLVYGANLSLSFCRFLT